MPITNQEYLDMLHRTNAVKRASLDEATPSVAREKDLHDEIVETCKARGWIVFHARMDCRTTYPLGTPDFIIATDDGRTLYIECKRPGSKCTPAQNAMLAWLRKNHQKWAVVTSIQEFMEFVNQQVPYLTKEKEIVSHES